MAYTYYNPAHMQAPSAHLEHVRPVDLNDRFEVARLRMRTPYANRAEAEAHPYGGRVYFYDGEVIYTAEMVLACMYKPCTDVECECGINWNTYYAVSAERLCAYLSARYCKLYNFEPVLNAYGLYEIQVHYDGRCR